MVLPVDRFFRINQRIRRRPFGDDDYDKRDPTRRKPKKGEPTIIERNETDDEVMDEKEGQENED